MRNQYRGRQNFRGQNEFGGERRPRTRDFDRDYDTSYPSRRSSGPERNYGNYRSDNYSDYEESGYGSMGRDRDDLSRSINTSGWNQSAPRETAQGYGYSSSRRDDRDYDNMPNGRYGSTYGNYEDIPHLRYGAEGIADNIYTPPHLDRSASSSYDYDRHPSHGRNEQGWFERMGEKVGEFFGKGPKGYKRSDERIREDVSEALYRDAYVDASEIEVAVSDGEVTLTGSVPEKRMKRLAHDIAENVSGVRDVHNNVRLASLSTPGTKFTGDNSMSSTSRSGSASKRPQ